MDDQPADEPVIDELDEKLENLSLENNKKPYKLGRRRRRSDSVDDDNDSQRSSNHEENLNDDDDDEEEEDGEEIIPLERESGDGEEVPHPPTNRSESGPQEDRKNPAFVPKRGVFYQHDLRITDDSAAEPLKQSKKQQFLENQSKWRHDMFYEDEQAPKSRQELINIYGYDIRNEGRAPLGARVRKYGRSQKQTRDWRDPDSYLPRPRYRGGGPSKGRGSTDGVVTDDQQPEPNPGRPTADEYDEYPPLRNSGDVDEPANQRVDRRRRTKSFEESDPLVRPIDGRNAWQSRSTHGYARQNQSHSRGWNSSYRGRNSNSFSQYEQNYAQNYAAYQNNDGGGYRYDSQRSYDRGGGHRPPTSTNNTVKSMEFRRRSDMNRDHRSENRGDYRPSYANESTSASTNFNRKNYRNEKNFHQTPREEFPANVGAAAPSSATAASYEVPPRFQHKDSHQSGSKTVSNGDPLNDTVNSSDATDLQYDDIEPNNQNQANTRPSIKRYSALRQQQVVANQQPTVSPPQPNMMTGSMPPTSIVHAMPPQQVLHAYGVPPMGAVPVPMPPYAAAYFDGYQQAPPQGVYTADIGQTQFVPAPGYSAPPEAYCMPRVTPGQPVPPSAYVTPVSAQGYHHPMMAPPPPQYNVAAANESQQQQVYSPHVTYYNPDQQAAAYRQAPKPRPKSVIAIVPPSDQQTTKTNTESKAEGEKSIDANVESVE